MQGFLSGGNLLVRCIRFVFTHVCIYGVHIYTFIGPFLLTGQRMLAHAALQLKKGKGDEAIV